MKHAVHLSDDLMVRALDDELATGERIFVERHLAACPTCRERRRHWAELSDRVQEQVAGTAVPAAAAREKLAAALGVTPPASAAAGRRRWARPWVGIAAAACLIILAAVPAIRKSAATRHAGAFAHPPAAAAADLRGDEDEFIPLPYSATGAGYDRVVRVEFPVSALAAEGILPADVVDSAAMAGDEWVLADVALGLDGQPAGIRLVDAAASVRN